MKTSHSLFKDITGTFATQIVIMLSALIVNKVLSNNLSIEDFGQYNIIKRSATVISFTILGGLGIAIPKFISTYLTKKNIKLLVSLLRAALGYLIITSCIVIGIIICIGKDFREDILGNSSLTLVVIICAFSFFNAFSTFISAYYRGYNDFKSSNLIAISIGGLIILPLFFFHPLTVSTVYLSWTLVYSVLSIIFFIIPPASPIRILSKYKSSFLEVYKELNLLSRYSLPRLLGDIFLFTFSAFPLIYIGAKEGVAAAAYYSVGMTFVTLATPVFSFVGVILLPYVSSNKSLGKEENNKANRLVDNFAKIYTVLSLLIVGILSIGMPFFIDLFFSTEYIKVSYLARIMIIAIIPQAYYLLYRNPIDATKNFPYNTINLGMCLLTLVLLFFTCTSLIQYAVAYVCISWLQGIISFIIWQKIKK